MKSKLEDGQCGFRPGRSTTDQIFTLKQHTSRNLGSVANIALHACFVDLEKAFDRVSRDKLWKVLRKYGADGQLLRAIKSFYCRPEICVRVSSFMWALNSGKAAFCHLSFSLFTSGVTKIFL